MKNDITVKQWLGLIGISLLAFTCFLDITIVSNALPAIRKSLSATDTQLQWLVNAIYVALCACMATVGRMGDVYGLRKIFYISMAIMGLSSLACGLSSSIEMLIFFRAIQGISLASITMTAALISHNFPLNQQPKAMAFFSAFAGLGLALGPVIGGLLVDFLNWRWIFFINVPIVIIGISICSLTLTEQKNPHKQSIDWTGAILFIISITSLVVTLIEGSNWGWNSAAVLSGFTLSAISLIAFVINEKKVNTPLMPFHLLANSVFISAALTCATCGAFIAVLLFFDPLYLQTILNFTATESGWILLSTSLAYVVMSPIAGWITHHLNPKIGTCIVCGLLMIAGCFHAFFGIPGQMPIILMGLISFGLAWGTVNVPPVVAVLHSTGTQNAGVMLGALWTLFNLGSAIMLAFLGIIFRFYEYKFLLMNLQQFTPQLTFHDVALLQELVKQPEQTRILMKQFPSYLTNHILPAYHLAFIQSYHIVSWILFAMASLAFMIVLLFMRNVNLREKIQHTGVV